MLKALVNAFRVPDLRKKILFTIAMLIAFRLISHIPVPMVDPAALSTVLRGNAILSLMDLFSGGAMVNFSVAASGVYPYITASIVMTLLVPIIPKLDEISKEGEQGQAKINKWTYWLTIPLAALQAYGQVSLLSRSGGGVFKAPFQFDLFSPTYWLPSLSIIASMICGTMVLIWLGDLITEQGIGNGLSMIIFGGIVSRLPSMVLGMVQTGTTSTVAGWGGVVGFVVIGLLTIVGIVLIQEGKRELRVQYSRRVRGTKLYGGGSTTLPLKVNMAGMIPLIFAQSVMVFPGTIASYLVSGDADPTKWNWLQTAAHWVTVTFNGDNYVYWILLFFLVIVFTYFYTLVVFNQTNISDNLRKSGGFIPGYRPGEQTSRLLTNIVNRITMVGALFLGVVAVLPFVVQKITGVEQVALSATGLLIVVGVAVDTMKQLESQLMMRRYEGFL